MLFLVSSKKSEYDFIESYIKKQLGKPGVMVIDAKLWDVKPDGTYCGKKFKVAVGGNNMPSKILSSGEDPEEYNAHGYYVIDVPIEFKGRFEMDIDAALMNIAGISISNVTRFITYDNLSKCYIESNNPFSQNILVIGMHDKLKIQDFFKPESVSEEIYNMPLFVHIDTSLTGDKTGISAVGVVGYRYQNEYDIETGDTIPTKELMYRHVFTVGIQCPPMSEISFQKTREFIYYLKNELRWNIKAVSLDGYQSADSRQQFETMGFEDSTIVSLDKTPNGYLAYKSAINEKRIALYSMPELETEIINLEQNNMSGKVDHPVGGCLVSETLIKTNNGDKKIVDLKEGVDMVYAYDLETKSIVEVNFKNLRKTKDTDTIYKIETVDGKIIECTDNHLILTQRGYVRADSLTESDSIISAVKLPILKDKNRRGCKLTDVLNEYRDVITYLYVEELYSISDLVYITNVPKTTLNGVLSDWGIKRNKSEAQKIAMKKYSSKLVSCSSITFKEFKNKEKDFKCRTDMLKYFNCTTEHLKNWFKYIYGGSYDEYCSNNF